MTDLLERVRSELASRLEELRPAIDEHATLEAAAKALGKPSNAAPPRRTRAPARASSQPRSKAKVRVSTGGRASQILDAVAAQPGLGSSAIADRLSMNRTYTSQLVSRLVRDGQLRRRGRGLHPVNR